MAYTQLVNAVYYPNNTLVWD